ncbi:MAG: ABC transporter ATP-binding protein [Promethearchaeota archaeon]
MAEHPVIKLENVKKDYLLPSGPLHVLRGASLEVARGEMVAIMGPSGSGKSTLLNVLGLLDEPTSGRYVLAGVDVTTLKFKEKQRIRLEKIGFVFQTFNLIPTLTVRENVEVPMALLGLSQEEQRERALELMELLGIADRADHLPHQVSIGEQQRAAIARAMVNHPSIVLCDEPTGNLDSERAKSVMEHVRKLLEVDATVVVVSHNAAWLEYATRAYELRRGVLEPLG